MLTLSVVDDRKRILKLPATLNSPFSLVVIVSPLEAKIFVLFSPLVFWIKTFKAVPVIQASIAGTETLSKLLVRERMSNPPSFA